MKAQLLKEIDDYFCPNLKLLFKIENYIKNEQNTDFENEKNKISKLGNKIKEEIKNKYPNTMKCKKSLLSNFTTNYSQIQDFLQNKVDERVKSQINETKICEMLYLEINNEIKELESNINENNKSEIVNFKNEIIQENISNFSKKREKNLKNLSVEIQKINENIISKYKKFFCKEEIKKRSNEIENKLKMKLHSDLDKEISANSFESSDNQLEDHIIISDFRKYFLKEIQTADESKLYPNEQKIKKLIKNIFTKFKFEELNNCKNKIRNNLEEILKNNYNQYNDLINNFKQEIERELSIFENNIKAEIDEKMVFDLKNNFIKMMEKEIEEKEQIFIKEIKKREILNFENFFEKLFNEKFSNLKIRFESKIKEKIKILIDWRTKEIIEKQCTTELENYMNNEISKKLLELRKKLLEFINLEKILNFKSKTYNNLNTHFSIFDNDVELKLEELRGEINQETSTNLSKLKEKLEKEKENLRVPEFKINLFSEIDLEFEKLFRKEDENFRNQLKKEFNSIYEYFKSQIEKIIDSNLKFNKTTEIRNDKILEVEKSIENFINKKSEELILQKISTLKNKKKELLTKEINQFETKNKDSINEYVLYLTNKLKEILKKNNEFKKKLNIEIGNLKEYDKNLQMKNYDLIIYCESLSKQFIIEKSLNNFENYSTKIKQPVVTLMGNFDKGKSFLLSELSRKELPSGFNISTPSICAFYPNSKEESEFLNAFMIDTAGFEVPIQIPEVIIFL